MAQITLRLLAFSTIVALAPALPHAQAAAQVTAAQAETAGQWDEAIRLHRAEIAADPRRSEPWVRIADIEARRGNLPACIDALGHAVAAAPGDATLYSRLSQAYASAGFGPAALHAIDGALALKPREAEYLRARATLATWVADYSAAQDSYRQLESLGLAGQDIALAYARVSAWAGDTDEAVTQYNRYLRQPGASVPVWLELAKAESWRGNYVGALDALETYRAHAGETEAYQAELATVLANGGLPSKAENLLTGLLAQHPDDYGLNLTRAIALARQHRAKEAFESLDRARQLAPAGKEAHTTERVLRTLLSSFAEAPVTAYSDSDDLEIQRAAPRATIALTTGTQFSGGYERSRLQARPGSGLERLDGSGIATYEHTWAGAAQRFGRMMVSGQAGYATAAQHSATTYAVDFDAQLMDTMRLRVSRRYGLFVVSPRTVDLGLTATGHQAHLEWTPALQYRVELDGSFQDLSDGNRRWEITVSPTKTVARRARFNLDLGATAYRLETTEDFNHGYYDPRRYEYYAATMFPYFKLRENVGLAMTIVAGAQRDNLSPSFHFGANVSGEATFGIYRPWLLKISSSATLNGRLDSGAFRGFGAGAALVRRF